MQLVPVITIEEVELALISMRLAWQTDEYQRLQDQLEPLESAFAAFEYQVAQKSGGLTAERDRLREICSEMEQYTARIHARLAADPDGHLAAVFSQDELRRIGQLCGVDVPDSWFEDELRATTFGEGWYATDSDRPENPLESRELPPESEMDELRTLYRELARTFHPDLAEDTNEHSFRQEVMLRINHAWHLRDLNGMRAIRHDVRDLLTGKQVSATAYKLAWYQRELTAMEEKCSVCADRIAALRTSKTFALWHNPTLAGTAISRYISRLRNEIEALQMRHESAMDEFRLALGAYAASR